MSDLTLSRKQKAYLLALARETIRAWLEEKSKPAPEVSDDALQQPCGAFVTLNTANGELRGCIGHILARGPLYQTVIECAISAACEDPRFPSVGREELDGLKIEISVLSPPRVVASHKEIDPGKHGLIVTKGFSKGLLLPQVAARHGWDALTFLEQTCRKAGLPATGWREGAVIEVFSALVFGEDETT